MAKQVHIWHRNLAKGGMRDPMGTRMDNGHVDRMKHE